MGNNINIEGTAKALLSLTTIQRTKRIPGWPEIVCLVYTDEKKNIISRCYTDGFGIRRDTEQKYTSIFDTGYVEGLCNGIAFMGMSIAIKTRSYLLEEILCRTRFIKEEERRGEK